MVPSHYPVYACSRLSGGLANPESDAHATGTANAGKKTMETLPATFPLSEPERVQTQAGVGLPVMVPLSIPEIRRLFFYLLEKPPLARLFHLGWSFFRRTHQAVARRCHYKRRLASSH